MTKKDVYVVVDTPKKAKKLNKVLEMFKEPIYSIPDDKSSSHNGSVYGWAYGFYDGKWQGFNTKWYGNNGKEFKEVSIKELRNILAKEHLKVGDYVVLSNDLIGKIIKLVENSEILVLDGENDKITCLIRHFKRYATPEEIALLEPKQNELEVGKWYLYLGHKIAKNPLMLITQKNDSIVRFCGFNFLGEWTDEDFYSLEDLKKYGYREATPQEVEFALIKEAKRRYKVGDNVKSLVTFGESGNLDFKKVYYLHDNNDLWISSEYFNIKVFVNGKWAEVIENDDKPKVGDVCKFWEDDENGFTVGTLLAIEEIDKDILLYQSNYKLWFRHAKKLTQQEVIDLLFNNGGN